MERRKRRKYTPEYKAEVVNLVEAGGQSIAQLSSELELTESAVRNWLQRAAIDEKKDPNGPLTGDERAEVVTRKGDGATPRQDHGGQVTGIEDLPDEMPQITIRVLPIFGI